MRERAESFGIRVEWRGRHDPHGNGNGNGNGNGSGSGHPPYPYRCTWPRAPSHLRGSLDLAAMGTCPPRGRSQPCHVMDTATVALLESVPSPSGWCSPSASSDRQTRQPARRDWSICTGMKSTRSSSRLDASPMSGSQPSPGGPLRVTALPALVRTIRYVPSERPRSRGHVTARIHPARALGATRPSGPVLRAGRADCQRGP